MITNEQMHRSQRLAGMVKRYHDHPTLREQTVAEHSWHVARIWLSIFGRGVYDESTARVLAFIVHHDSGEFGVGDLPFPVKKNNPDLKVVMDRVEEASLRRLGVSHVPILDFEKDQVKISELVEMAEFGLHETRLGSAYGAMITQDTLDVVRGMLAGTSLTRQVRVREYVLRELEIEL